jgi:hypothetical protein
MQAQVFCKGLRLPMAIGDSYSDVGAGFPRLARGTFKSGRGDPAPADGAQAELGRKVAFPKLELGNEGVTRVGTAC